MDVRAWNEKWQHGVCAWGAHVMLGLWISFNTSACHVEFVQLWLLNPLKAVVNISLLESAGSVSCTGGLWVDDDPPALYRAVSRSASAHKFQSKKKQHLCRSICFCWVFQILLFTRGRKRQSRFVSVHEWRDRRTVRTTLPTCIAVVSLLLSADEAFVPSQLV